MNCRRISRVLFLATFNMLAFSTFCQSVKQEKMAQLSFMVGEWIGTSKTYENGKMTNEVSAYEKISYDLDSNILVIELNSESLQLHTIIYYDEKEGSYFYFPFSKKGVRKIPARFEDEHLNVESSESRRYIFGKSSNGNFQEYGEQLIDGKWVKYFQDDFKNNQ